MSCLLIYQAAFPSSACFISWRYVSACLPAIGIGKAKDHWTSEGGYPWYGSLRRCFTAFATRRRATITPSLQERAKKNHNYLC
jgi:hypothetical protein